MFCGCKKGNLIFVIQRQIMGRLYNYTTNIHPPTPPLEKYTFPPYWCLVWLCGLPWPKEYDGIWQTTYSDRGFKDAYGFFGLASYLFPAMRRICPSQLIFILFASQTDRNIEHTSMHPKPGEEMSQPSCRSMSIEQMFLYGSY